MTTNVHPETGVPSWYVTDPQTGSTKLVAVDAKHTARWVV